MPKLTDLDQIFSADIEATDLMYIVDSSETDPDLKSKKITMADVIGSIKAISGTDLGEWVEVNSDYTIVDNKQIYVNVFNDQDITITFPPSPVASSQILIVTNRLSSSSGTVFINLNGQKYNYESYVNNLFIGRENLITRFIYVNSNIGWMSDPKTNFSVSGSPYTYIMKYIGTGATRTLSALPFDPDLIMIKNDTDSRNWVLSSTAFNNNNWSIGVDFNAEGSYWTNNTLINNYSNGVFTLGTHLHVNELNKVHMFYAFKKDPNLGFNIVNYVGNSINPRAVPHGLPIAPTFYIIRRDSGLPWLIYHKIFDAETYTTTFDGSSLSNASANDMRPRNPDNTNIYVGNSSWNNEANANYVLYAWTDVPGIFSSGSYFGTGYASNGPKIQCGFKPRIVWIKPLPHTASSMPLLVFDDVLDAPNPLNRALKASTGPTGAQQGWNTGGINLTAEGFDVLENTGNNYSWLNTLGVRYMYVAWA